MAQRFFARMVGWGLLAGSAASSAHHSTAMYDYSKSETLSGVVRQFQWTNPHCFLQLVVTDDKGNKAEWPIETGTPSGMARMGWKKTSLKPGDQVTVVVAPMKDGVGGTLRTVTLADGTMLSGIAAGIKTEASGASSISTELPEVQKAPAGQP